jgi:hypothetical protein
VQHLISSTLKNSIHGCAMQPEYRFGSTWDNGATGS